MIRGSAKTMPVSAPPTSMPIPTGRNRCRRMYSGIAVYGSGNCSGRRQQAHPRQDRRQNPVADEAADDEGDAAPAGDEAHADGQQGDEPDAVHVRGHAEVLAQRQVLELR